MRLPRDVSGHELAKRFESLDDSVTLRKGSHMRLTTKQNREHHVAIPSIKPLRDGSLRSIPTDGAARSELDNPDTVLIKIRHRTECCDRLEMPRARAEQTAAGLIAIREHPSSGFQLSWPHQIASVIERIDDLLSLQTSR